jgi:hypothetical protein
MRKAPAESTEPLDASLIVAMLRIICGIAVGMSDAIARIGLPWRNSRVLVQAQANSSPS